MLRTRIRQTVVILGAAFLVASCGVAAYAASQVALRHHFLASLGYVTQRVDWELPDPGFDWELKESLEIEYTWDWTASSNWPASGSPAQSIASAITTPHYSDSYDSAYNLGTYSIMSSGETSYFTMVELRMVIHDPIDELDYVCLASSTQGTDAYNNVMSHEIAAEDWIITLDTTSP